MRKKITMLFALLLVCVGAAKAQTVAIAASTSVETPENQYVMKSGNGYWMTSFTSPSETKPGRFAFFAVDGKEDTYQIYSIDRQKWVSYTLAGSYSNATGIATLVDSKDEAQGWKAVLKTVSDVDYYQFAPYNTTGVASKYMNWFQGLSSNALDNETTTIGLWQDDATKDAGSRWTLAQLVVPETGVEYVLKDLCHQTYLDLVNLGKETNDQSRNQLATMSDAWQPLYITTGGNGWTWSIHTAADGGNYLHQDPSNRSWNSWVSNAGSEFAWIVEIGVNNGEICYLLKHESGNNNGYLGADVHSNATALYVNNGSDKAVRLTAVEAEKMRQAVTVTYNFKYNNEVKYTQEIETILGEEFPEYTVKFPAGVTAAAKPEGTVTAENSTQDITLTVELPFVVSTLTDGEFGENMTWYNLTLRGKDVTYDAASGKALAENVTEKDYKNLFAFTGNPFDGYRIYTYAAGANKVLWPENDNNGTRAFFTENTTGTWMMYKNNNDGYQFRLKDSENGWLNDHKPDLAIWQYSLGATDGGSTFTFTLVENPDLTILYDITYNFVYNEEVKSTYTTTVAENAAYPTVVVPVLPYGVTANATTPEGIVKENKAFDFELTLEHDLPFVAAADVNSIDTWYYAQMHKNSAVTAYLQDDENANNNIDWNDKSVNPEEIESNLWGFAGDIWTGIKMVNKGTGRAIVSTSGAAVMGDKANATAFTPVYSNGAYDNWFCLKYPESDYLNAQGDQEKGEGKVSSYGDADNGSSIKLTKYQEKDVTISEVGYSTLYLDYATYIPEGVEVYAVSEIENGYVTLKAVEGVLPANTGVIVKNEGKYTFKAAGATANVTSLLSGSATDTYVEGVAYVLANGTQGVGLYKAELNKNEAGEAGTTHFKNNANKAYLVVPAEEAGAAMFSLDRGEGTTSIEQIAGDAELVIYDLSGRRVEKMEKGIYIVNGKKVVK